MKQLKYMYYFIYKSKLYFEITFFFFYLFIKYHFTITLTFKEINRYQQEGESVQTLLDKNSYTLFSYAQI